MFRLTGRMAAVFLVLSQMHGVSHAAEERVSAVEVRGNRRIEAATILSAVRVKAGDTLNSSLLDADLRAVYRLGFFQDVRVEAERDAKGTTIIFVVAEKPYVREIRFEGNKELTVEKLRDACELKAGSLYSPRDLTRSVQKMKKRYAHDGYYLAEIEPVMENRTGSDLSILFRITEGDKVLIKTIRFEGNKVFPDKRLKKAMETSESWFMSWLTEAGTYREEVLKNDANLIADLYFNNGYINVKVGEPKVELLQDRTGLLVTIGITEGEQFRTGAIGFKGDLLESESELRKKLKLAPGEVFSRESLRSDIIGLTDSYADKGYAFANISPATKVNGEVKTVDVTYEVEKGEKVYIDRISIAGNAKTRDKVVRRELKLAEGDLYGSTPLRQSKQNLMNLGFFEEVNISTPKGSSNNLLNMNVEVKEKSTGTFSIGAGYSSLDGLIGTGSVQQANFLGLGLKANLAASLGGKTQTYNLGLTDSHFLDSNWTVGGDLYRTERDYSDYNRRSTGGDIKAGYALSDTLSTFWIYKYEATKIYQISEAYQKEIDRGLVIPPDTNATTSSITASITHNTTDYRLDPSSGTVSNLSVEFAGLGGSNRFIRYIGNSAIFFPFKWSTVLSFKGEVGYIHGLSMDVPVDEKFYLGGIGSVRGYNNRTVSPYRTVDGTNVFLGGDAESYFNAEYQFPLLKEAGLKGVIFYDIGNADNDLGKVFSNLQMSYGAGIRWNSPLGPLRLEYGIPVNPRSGVDKTSGKLEFSIGSFF